MDFGGKRKRTQKPLIEPGDHLGICYSIIDLGTQEVKVSEKYGGGTKQQGKVEFAFEFPEFECVFNEEKGRQKMSHWVMQTKSFYGNSRLKAMLESWSKKTIGNNEAVDLKIYLSRACLITIEQNPDKSGATDDNTGKTIIWQNMAGQPTKLSDADRESYVKKGFLKGEKGLYQTENEAIYFDLSNFDQEVFNKLHKFKQETIAKSPEFQALVAAGKAKMSTEGSGTPQVQSATKVESAEVVTPEVVETTEVDDDEVEF